MTRFPIELVIYVLELTFFTITRLPDRRTLSACSRVCKEWRDPAQLLLFRYIVLQLLRHPLQGMKDLFLVHSHGQALGSYLRSLDLRIGPANHMGYPPHELPLILSFFPRLYELHLNSSVLALDDETIQKLRTLVAGTPTHYRLRCLKWFGPNPQSNMMYQLLDLWPTIQFLYIGNPIACEPPPQRPNFTLYEIGYIKPPTTNVLKWLIPEHSLRVVYLQDDNTESDTTKLFNREGPHILSVRIQTYTLFSASLVSRCPRLKELNMGPLPKELTEDMNGTIPRSLEHLRIREDPDSIAVILKVLDGLPALRVITLPIKVRKLKGVEDLEARCVKQSVQLVYSSAAKNIVRES